MRRVDVERGFLGARCFEDHHPNLPSWAMQQGSELLTRELGYTTDDGL